MNRGAFIVFEGIDRSGKTTQCRLIKQFLENLNMEVRLMEFPDRTTQSGKLINAFLQNIIDLPAKALFNLFSMNRWEKEPDIYRLLNAGINIVCSRYAYSGVAYASINPEICHDDLKGLDAGLPRPDLVICLDINPEKAAERPDFGKEETEVLAKQISVYNSFKLLVDSNWKIVDANRPIAEVKNDIEKYILEVIRRPKGDIEKIWCEFNCLLSKND